SGHPGGHHGFSGAPFTGSGRPDFGRFTGSGRPDFKGFPTTPKA
ncbi:unnamed protein product, partial [Mesorhabditis spiculigera]